MNPLNPFTMFKNAGAERLLADARQTGEELIEEGVEERNRQQARATQHTLEASAALSVRREIAALHEVKILKEEIESLKGLVKVERKLTAQAREDHQWALQQAVEIEKEADGLRVQLEEATLEKSAFQRAAFNILRNQKASYLAMGRLAKAWGHPFEQDTPEKDQAFGAHQREIYESMAQDPAKIAELEGQVQSASMKLKKDITEEALEIEGQRLGQASASP